MLLTNLRRLKTHSQTDAELENLNQVPAKIMIFEDRYPAEYAERAGKELVKENKHREWKND